MGMDGLFGERQDAAWDGRRCREMVSLRHRTQPQPSGYALFFLAAVLANLSKLKEAKVEAEAGLALDPTFTVRRFDPPER